MQELETASAHRWPSLSPLREAVAAGALVGVAYLLLRTSPSLAAGAFSDDGVYLSLGKALASGEGYRSLYAVGAPVQLKYPPGLPAIYAALWALRNDLGFVHSAAILLSLLVSALTAGILWWIGRARLGLPVPLIATFVLGPFLLEGSVQYFNLPVAEPWFMLGWACCLLLYPRAADGEVRWAVLLGVLAATTALVRTQAVVLIPTLALALGMQRRDWRRPAVLVMTGLVPLVAWAVWHGARVAVGPVSTQPDEATYASWAPSGVGAAVLFLGQILRSQAVRYWVALPLHLAPWAWLGALLWAGIFAGFALGAVRKVRSWPWAVLPVLGGAGVILLWPYSQDRFVLALLPFAGLVVAGGYHSLVAALTRGGATSGPRGSAALSVLLAVTVVVITVRQGEIRRLAADPPAEGTFYFHPAQFLRNNTEFLVAAGRWLGTEARPDDRLLTPLSSGLWLYTGRRGVNATPAEPNVGPSVFDVPGRFLARRVLEDDVTLLLLWNPNFLITRDGAEVQRACPDALQFLTLTAEPARVAIFRIHRDDPCFVSRFLEPARESTAAAR